MGHIVCINGSPRREGNSATLLVNAEKGAQQAGADTVRYDLVAHKFRGCISCFACKELGGRSFGRCAVKDALSPILDDVLSADGLILSVPVYFGDVPGMVRSLLERLWFPGLQYAKDGSITYTKRVPSLFIYTMNAANENIYTGLYEQLENITGHILGPSHRYVVTDTLQFSDYTRYASEMFDGEAKLRRHNEVFPEQCVEAHRLGAQLAAGWPEDAS